ncbi:putative chemotaxis phosphatase, CheZ [Pseudoxanthomonas suwonensis 11-1]|uniref:Protein phosphatase CheZ n=1 Tax=Pseudoxanthomonas suwonensis (strain 11-1) TaxID=743721 RepID=E6WT96_PSEUU|nr:protein phosphatase CheZ [Pseudoxanthomonas suwonensis]ADV27325.1 putative chemotaxis phosphatase, CheZ [Pseudoxanthomonas suwonensis 11-1]
MNTTASPERTALVQRLHDALEALERGDESALRNEIDALAAARTRPLVQGLGRLARELSQALGELPQLPAEATEASGVELDDACARLDHVIDMTEQATHRTLDLADECRALVEGLRAEGVSDGQDQVLDRIRSNLTEIALTQSYQDITGQIIKRVAGIVRRVHEGFGELGLPPRGESREPALAGPAVAGIDRHAVSQVDADALLADLGL